MMTMMTMKRPNQMMRRMTRARMSDELLERHGNDVHPAWSFPVLPTESMNRKAEYEAVWTTWHAIRAGLGEREMESGRCRW